MSQNFWNAEDTEFLIANYATMSNVEIAERVGRNSKAVCAKAALLGLIGTKTVVYKWDRDDPRKNVNWTDDEIAYLRANYETVSISDMSAHLGKSRKSVYGAAARLGLRKPGNSGRKSDRTEEERREAERIRRRNWYRNNRKGKPRIVRPEGWRPKHFWAEEDEQFLRANWHKMSISQLSEKLNRAPTPIRNKATRMGLGAKTSVTVPRSGPGSRMHPLPTAPLEPTTQQILAARSKMKSKPGPMSLGWRVRSSWR